LDKSGHLHLVFFCRSSTFGFSKIHFSTGIKPS
jgi:hypothetical protein